jgi:hypothetical protein
MQEIIKTFETSLNEKIIINTGTVVAGIKC